jgi:hypothetical protein
MVAWLLPDLLQAKDVAMVIHFIYVVDVRILDLTARWLEPGGVRSSERGELKLISRKPTRRRSRCVHVKSATAKYIIRKRSPPGHAPHVDCRVLAGCLCPSS